MLNVLMVDDSAADRALIKRAFSSAGPQLNLLSCNDGDDALDLLYHRGGYAEMPRPDVCLMDIKMPGRSGFDVLDQMKRDEALRSIPVFMVSGSDAQEDVQTAYHKNASGYIHKPNSAKDLSKMAQTLVDLWSEVLELP